MSSYYYTKKSNSGKIVWGVLMVASIALGAYLMNAGADAQALLPKTPDLMQVFSVQFLNGLGAYMAVIIPVVCIVVPFIASLFRKL